MTITVRSRRLRRGESSRQTLYLDYYDPNRRPRRWLEYLGLYLTGGSKKADRERDKATREIAEDIAAKRRLEIKNSEEGFAFPEKRKADFVEYCRRMGEKKRTPNTRVVWRNAVAHLETFAGGALPFSQLQSSVLEEFRDYLLQRLKQNSAQVYLARIKTAIHRAVKDRILTSNPAAAVSIKKQKTRREFLRLEELEKLEAAPIKNAETKAAFLFSAFAGLRYSDVRALTWGQVRRANGTAEIVYTQEKTDEEETLPLSAEATAVLDAQAAARNGCQANPTDPVFDLPAQQTMDKAIRRWIKRAGVGKKISFHNARHSFATLSLTHGVDIYTVSKLLGHKRLETTEIYAHVIDEKKRAAVAMLPRLKKNGGPKGGGQLPDQPKGGGS